MFELPADEVYELREDLKFAEGRWLSANSLPEEPTDPILGIVVYHNHISGKVGLTTILVWDGAQWNTRYIDNNDDIDIPYIGIQRELLSSCEIIKWKELSAALPGSGLRGDYYSNTVLSGSPVWTNFENINFTWLTAGPVPPILSATNFSVQWTGFLKVLETDDYRFRFTCDDGIRMYFGVSIFIDSMGIHPVRTVTSGFTTLAAGYHDITVQFYNLSSTAQIKFEWDRQDTPGFTVVAASSLYIPSYL